MCMYVHIHMIYLFLRDRYQEIGVFIDMWVNDTFIIDTKMLINALF